MIIQTETPIPVPRGRRKKKKKRKGIAKDSSIRSIIRKNSVRFSAGAPQLQKSMGSNLRSLLWRWSPKTAKLIRDSGSTKKEKKKREKKGRAVSVAVNAVA